ncbi:hypothetical protein AURDEDRAFT_160721 [Auricularia subglabra TFB-10046 SS5]|nr:hypothetical protein AURDEDRAFT_160721 [Auricularia subglabra TFB-10046 SS5]
MDKCEGFLDLLAAYKSIVEDVLGRGYPLSRMPEWEKTLADAAYSSGGESGYAYMRMSGLLKRCNHTLDKSGIPRPARNKSSSTDALVPGPAQGTAPWRMSIFDSSLPVEHISVFSKNGIPIFRAIFEKTVLLPFDLDYMTGESSQVIFAMVHGPFKIPLCGVNQGLVPFREGWKCRIAYDGDGFGYLRCLPGGREPVRRAPSSWPGMSAKKYYGPPGLPVADLQQEILRDATWTCHHRSAKQKQPGSNQDESTNAVSPRSTHTFGMGPPTMASPRPSIHGCASTSVSPHGAHPPAMGVPSAMISSPTSLHNALHLETSPRSGRASEPQSPPQGATVLVSPRTQHVLSLLISPQPSQHGTPLGGTPLHPYNPSSLHPLPRASPQPPYQGAFIVELPPLGEDTPGHYSPQSVYEYYTGTQKPSGGSPMPIPSPQHAHYLSPASAGHAAASLGINPSLAAQRRKASDRLRR